MVNFIAKLLPDHLKPYAGRIFWTVVGLAIAIFFLTIGFWKTMLVVLLCVAGYLFGMWRDGALNTSRFNHK